MRNTQKKFKVEQNHMSTKIKYSIHSYPFNFKTSKYFSFQFFLNGYLKLRVSTVLNFRTSVSGIYNRIVKNYVDFNLFFFLRLKFEWEKNQKHTQNFYTHVQFLAKNVTL